MTHCTIIQNWQLIPWPRYPDKMKENSGRLWSVIILFFSNQHRKFPPMGMQSCPSWGITERLKTKYILLEHILPSWFMVSLGMHSDFISFMKGVMAAWMLDYHFRVFSATFISLRPNPPLLFLRSVPCTRPRSVSVNMVQGWHINVRHWSVEVHPKRKHLCHGPRREQWIRKIMSQDLFQFTMWIPPFLRKDPEKVASWKAEWLINSATSTCRLKETPSGSPEGSRAPDGERRQMSILSQPSRNWIDPTGLLSISDTLEPPMYHSIFAVVDYSAVPTEKMHAYIYFYRISWLHKNEMYLVLQQ